MAKPNNSIKHVKLPNENVKREIIPSRLTDDTYVAELPTLTQDSILEIAPTSTTDNALARYDGTKGQLQNSSIISEDNGDLKIGRYTHNVLFASTNTTPQETVIHTKIKYASGSYMPVIRIYGYAYGLQSPIEFKLAFYIYSGNMG